MTQPVRLLSAIFLCAATVFAQGGGEISLNIAPAGQNVTVDLQDLAAFLGGELPPHSDDQLEIYERLSRMQPGLTYGDLGLLFKQAGVEPAATPESVESPKQGVFVTRDAFGVPFVSALKREDLLFGIGWATARDRLLFMDLGRHLARGRSSEFVGPFAAIAPEILDLAAEYDAIAYRYAGYSDAQMAAQYAALPERFGAAGAQLHRDFESYAAGVNAWIERTRQRPWLLPVEYALLGQVEPWTELDSAFGALAIEVLFGGGGGREHANAELLTALRAGMDKASADGLFRDLRRAEDPEAVTTVEATYPYLQGGDLDGAGVALPDAGSVMERPAIEFSFSPAARSGEGDWSELLSGLQAMTEAAGGPRGHSNFLALTAETAAGGRPMLLGGPQTGYLTPQLLMEIGYASLGMAGRGVLPPGFPYLILGRGKNHAWSPTSAGGDFVDVRAELLCELNGAAASLESKAYVFEGECLPMYERTDTWCVGTCEEGETNATALVERTVHGLVFARATVDGAPVALVRERATQGVELNAAMSYSLMSSRVMSATGFRGAMALNAGSFNWLYVDKKDLAYFHSGVYPRRAAGVHPDLPSWGTGEFEWEGFLTTAEHPWSLNPASGYLASWNNKPAPGWRAADSEYGFGSVHRADLLDERLAEAVGAGSPVTAPALVEMMGDAGHTDLRAALLLRPALAALRATGPLAGKRAAAVAALEAWAAAGAQRRDRDGDGEYENSGAVALMDAFYPRLVHAAFDGQLAPFYEAIPLELDDAPGAIGSAYQRGFYGYLHKSIRSAVGAPVEGAFEVLRCADGAAAGCGAAVGFALDGAVAEMERRFGTADPAGWRADPEAEMIVFQSTGLLGVRPISWVNRPTFQQLIQLGP